MTEAYTVAAPNRIRRVMAARMRLSASEIPQVTLQATAGAERLAAGGGRADGPRITVTVRLLQVVARTLARHPRINSVIVDGETRLYETVNLGVATATSQGLLVPVIRDAGTLSLAEIAGQLASLRERAEKGVLRLEEMTGGTFTVTNLGPYGVGHFSPLVNPPQVAILGIGAMTPQVRPADAEFSVRPALPLSLTFDHAAVDGAEAAAFLHDLAQAIENTDPAQAAADTHLGASRDD